MARRNYKTTTIEALLAGVDFDSNPFEIPDDCVISSSNMLPSLSVGGLSVINGYTQQNPSFQFTYPPSSQGVEDTSGNQVYDTSGNKVFTT